MREAKNELWSDKVVRSFAANAADRFGLWAPLGSVRQRVEHIRERIEIIRNAKRCGVRGSLSQEQRNLERELCSIENAFPLREADAHSQESCMVKLQEAVVFSLAMRAVLETAHRAPHASKNLALDILVRTQPQVWWTWTIDAIEEARDEYGIEIPSTSIAGIVQSAHELLVQTLYVNTAVASAESDFS